MPVTVKQIAELAGVSRGTVDRALNGRGNVRPEVEKRILQIADEIVVISGGTLKEMGPGAEIFPKLIEGNVQCDACAKREAVFS